ncbi:hypothetical protein [Microbacterium sp. Root322]|uniref:hypothetical protein n=1 Tax=Microbacterium sp. Root322 TaxID=1736514 RepID=UPI000A98E9A0|nr:hypothetical protein [Microbacterium sp. Root322]
MAFDFKNLDATTRGHMLQELDRDERSGVVYESPRLSAHGQSMYAQLLRDALASGTPESFANELSSPGILNAMEQTVKGAKKVPSNAPSLLAGGEFNRYYVRGVAARAVDSGQKHVTVYRARTSGYNRPESEAQVGAAVSASELLEHLRATTLSPESVELPDVNSGLSVHL